MRWGCAAAEESATCTRVASATRTPCQQAPKDGPKGTKDCWIRWPSQQSSAMSVQRTGRPGPRGGSGGRPFNFTPTFVPQKEQRVVAVFLRYRCWGTPPPPKPSFHRCPLAPSLNPPFETRMKLAPFLWLLGGNLLHFFALSFFAFAHTVWPQSGHELNILGNPSHLFGALYPHHPHYIA